MPTSDAAEATFEDFDAGDFVDEDAAFYSEEDADPEPEEAEGDSEDESEDDEPEEDGAEDEDDEEEGENEDEAEPAKDEKKKPEAEPAKHKVKVNGEEKELTTDELVRLASKADGAEERFREANQMAREAQETIRAVKGLLGPIAGYIDQERGVLDMRRLGEDLILQRIEEEALPEEERRKRAALQEIEQLEAQRDQLRQQEDRHQTQEEAARLQQSYEKQFTEAAGTAGLPKTPHIMSRMAYWTMALAEANDGERPEPGEVAAKVKEEVGGDIKAHLEALDTDGLMEWLGKDRVRAISKALAKQVTAAQPKRGQRTEEAAPRPRRRRKPETTMDMDEYRDSLREKYGL